MRLLIIEENDNNQRLDRFLFKYMNKAPRSFIFRMIRRKNIELNGKKAKPEDIIYTGDEISLFLADATIDKFRDEIKLDLTDTIDLDIIYEDENLAIINKESGILSHGDGKNIVDSFIKYLIDNGEYDPKKEYNFTPSLNNRLDRNTSGILIASKNYNTLQDINKYIRNRSIKRYYLTMVKGEIKSDLIIEDFMSRENKKTIIDSKTGEKEIKTIIRPLKVKNGFSLIEVELITGRTHQIRAHLNFINHPIIGDAKYGDKETNKFFKEKFKLKDQFLHSYKLKFTDIKGELSCLNNKEFTSDLKGKIKDIERCFFGK